MSNIIKIHERWHFGKLRLSRKKKWVIGIIITILLIVGSATAWLIISNQKSSQVARIAKETSQTVEDAKKLANNGSIDDAKTAYDGAIKKTEDPYQKSVLLLSKATLYYNDGKYDDALATAKEAESINQTDNVTNFIARIYEKKGDKQKAIEYYQKTITLIDKSQPLANADAKYYQSKIEALGGAKD